MRYYSIIIKDKTGRVIAPTSQNGLTNVLSSHAAVSSSTYTSYVNGQSLGGALDIQVQMQITGLANPIGGTTSNFIRIFGVSLEELSQSNLLFGYDITVMAGMQKGLPLANPNQKGVILHGSIYQAYGNWEGNVKSLDIMVQGVLDTQPRNFTFFWPKNTPLADAVRATLASAFPTTPKAPIVSIGANYVMAADMVAVYANIDEFALAIRRLSLLPQFQKGNARPTYVNIFLKDNQLYAVDGSNTSYTSNSEQNPKKIEYVDMIGQPTWIQSQQIQVKTVMRGDININDFVQLPAGLATPFVLTTPAAAVPGSRDDVTFKGTFNVQGIDHIGRFRGPAASDWVSIFTMVAVQTPPSASLASSTITGGIV